MFIFHTFYHGNNRNKNNDNDKYQSSLFTRLMSDLTIKIF